MDNIEDIITGMGDVGVKSFKSSDFVIGRHAKEKIEEIKEEAIRRGNKRVVEICNEQLGRMERAEQVSF